jgi:hypothetical protein
VRKTAIVLLALFVIFAFGCAKKKAEEPMLAEKEAPVADEYAEEAPAPEPMKGKRMDTPLPVSDKGPAGGAEEVTATDVWAEGIPEADAAEIGADLKLIKTADVTAEVENIDAGFEEVYAVAGAEKALVVGTTRAVADEGYSTGSVTIKVDPAKFDETMKELRKIGRILSEVSTTEDVTQEYFDLQARLENAERTRDRYLEILATRTGAVHDVLEVEREIERVTENVERLKGQMRYLESQIGLSTITVHLEEPHAAVPTGYNFGKAIKDAFRIALRICIFLIQAVIVLMPFIIILVLLVLVIRFIVWLWRRRRRKAQKAVTEA